jgi:lipopolysaccharide/colanic/teichoic acid biosynthesis glycosyltransferase
MRTYINERNRSFFVVKRFIDFTVSLFVLFLAIPLLILLFFLIWLNLGWPVFFTQNRPGHHGILFRMVKFRTMTNASDTNGKLFPDQKRSTILGRFLRKTSLDELPEFFNVLVGDMSLVGPRPLLVKYMPYYNEREKKRYNVKPGITGLAQVNGRNLLTWDKRLEMDVQYVNNLSIWLDIKILFLTAKNVICQKDALAVSSEVMPDFDEYRKEQLNIRNIGN